MLVLGDQPDEPAAIDEIVREAQAHPSGASPRPRKTRVGEALHRGRLVRGWRMVSVDLRGGEMTIEEEWGGVVTARRVQRLGGPR